jgi:hypothetical protein
MAVITIRIKCLRSVSIAMSEILLLITFDYEVLSEQKFNSVRYRKSRNFFDNAEP